jgi:hypothetical protein
MVSVKFISIASYAMMEKNNGSSINKLVVISGRMKHTHTHQKRCARPHYLAKEDAK